MTTAIQPGERSEKVDLWLRMYRQMVGIREFEAQVNELYTRALMPGLAHLYIGEEAIAVGVCEALERTDYITSTHRGHGHCLAKGASPDQMFAELLGKKAGYCKGKAGSMHIADPATGRVRGTGVRLEAASVDGQDVRSVHDISQRLVDRARRGDGPAFLLCNTYRYHGHHVGDINREYYRSKQEEQLWKMERDPIANFGKWLVEQKLADTEALAQMQAELESEMKKAVDFAVAAPYPTVDEVAEDVYA